MSKPTNRLWKCPTGKHLGVKAPQRLRRIDVRRYCLPCSEAAGVLVERTCAARERAAERSRAKAGRKAARQRRRQSESRAAIRARERAVTHPCGMDVEREYLRVWAEAQREFKFEIEATEIQAALEDRRPWRLDAPCVTLGENQVMRHGFHAGGHGVDFRIPPDVSRPVVCAFILLVISARFANVLGLDRDETRERLARVAYSASMPYGAYDPLQHHPDVIGRLPGWPNTGRPPRRPAWLPGMGPAVESKVRD